MHTTEAEDEVRSLIVRSFSPTVAVYASDDTDDLVKSKGFRNGLTDLVRPFGERVAGKIVIRDSTSTSRGWDDFGIHFVDLAQLCHEAVAPVENILPALDDWIETRIATPLTNSSAEVHADAGGVSREYRALLGRVLASSSLSPHQSFEHPVACVIAISSHANNPIETLRQLYAQTAHGNRTLPIHVNPDYLRYYVLVHDEEQSDFSRTSTLFDQMKRHFGLHCHLLRIRSTPCSPNDTDAVRLPPCEWMPPRYEQPVEDDSDQPFETRDIESPHVFEADVQALRSFVREMVAQSVIPHMESRVAVWNDQIASRRRGITGRIATFSKRWAGFGSGATSRNASNTNLGSSNSGNYESLQGLYRYDTSEAQLQKMADYSQMLRDYKLAASTYELLRTDYNNDKAWKHLAGANEMTVIAGLLNPLAVAGSKGLRLGDFENMLETATYSYTTRCNDPAAAVKATLTAIELLKVRGRHASELAARWAVKVLDWKALGDVSQAFVSERVVSCLAAIGNSSGEGKSWGWGRRRRKAAMWSVFTAEAWMKLGFVDLAVDSLEDADHFYEDAYTGRSWRLSDAPDMWRDFEEMNEYMHQLQSTARIKRRQGRGRGRSDAPSLLAADKLSTVNHEVREAIEDTTPDVVEQLDARPHRRSIINGPAIAPSQFDADSPTPGRGRRPESFALSAPPVRRDDDDFE